MEMDATFRLAGRAGGEGDQRDVVDCRVDIRELGGLAFEQGFERARAAAVEPVHLFQAGALRLRELHLLAQPHVAERRTDPGLVDDLPQLLRAQERHRSHGDAAGLDHPEPARRHHRIVRAAQQHAVAGDELEIVHERVGDLVGADGELPVGARVLLPVDHRVDDGALAVPVRDHPVEQLRGAVQPRRVPELRPLEQELRHLVRRGQVVLREGVDVRRIRHRSGPEDGSHKGHGGHGGRRERTWVCAVFLRDLCVYPLSVSLAMISFCTSVAPS
jgi:hypothetical protein